MELRPHQIKFSQIIADKLNKYKICYLAGEVRSGKTLTALNAASLFGAKKVLIITKKKAIDSIISDHTNFGFTFNLVPINYESLHKIKDKDFDLVIYDESHSLGAYPKRSKRTNLAKKMFYKLPCILMTGTAAVESYSQYYHQFYVSKYSPFAKYVNFYKWAKDYVDVKELRLPTHTVKDYSNANKDKIDKVLNNYMVVMSQADAGFTTKINEKFIYVETPDLIKSLANRLLKDKAIEGETGFILGDTPAKLQSKVSQLFNGHCIIEQANGDTFTKVFSHFKADFIAKHFKGKKIAIMYYFKAELDILNNVFDLAESVDEFNETDKNIAVQQNSTEGMNLSKADALVYYNLGFSGKNFIQSRDRMTVKERKHNNLYFVCETNGITKKVVDTVRQKKDFNTKLFKQAYGI